MKERSIKGFPNYKVTSNGTIFKVNKDGSKHKLTPYKNRDGGYDQVKLYKDGKRYTKQVHRLVIGEPNKDVDHIDGNKNNNNINNLQPLKHNLNVKKAFE